MNGVFPASMVKRKAEICRLNEYACSSDISKAYLQIGLNPKDRDSTRFLWPTDPEIPESPLITYRFKVVLFGATCSQFLLNATVLHHLSDISDFTSKELLKNIYVDNVQNSFTSETAMINFYHNSKTIMSNAGFPLREWSTNSNTLKNVAKENSDGTRDVINGILGMKWNTSDDSLSISPQLSQKAVTKREIVSEVARIYDPLGLFLGVSMRGRMIIQNIWKTKIQWDQKVADEILGEFSGFCADINLLCTLKIQRSLFLGKVLFLDIYADASQKAYGAVAYISNETQSKLVMARGRVAPIKILTLPQLELTSICLGVKLGKFLIETFATEFEFERVRIWSDSSIALSWIKNQNSKLPRYVANRVKEIKKNLPNGTFGHVSGKTNPADYVSRGVSFKTLKNSDLWWNGPPLPRENCSQTPHPFPENGSQTPHPFPANGSQNPHPSPEEDSQMNHFATENVSQISQFNPDNVPQAPLPQKPVQLNGIPGESVVNAGVENMKISFPLNVSDFSSLDKLILVICFVCLFIRLKLKLTLNKFSGTTSYALDLLVKNAQSTYFESILSFFSRGGRSPDVVKQFNLKLIDGVIVCQGRLKNADLKFPIFLPNNCHLVKLLILKIHNDKFHAGLNYVLATFREKFWIPKARQTIKKVLNRCVICKRYQGRAYHVMEYAPLPPERVKGNRPFGVTGVDLTGALHVKVNGNIQKVYIALFTCTLSRAVHLEIVEDLSEYEFVCAFRRFVSRRSWPSKMISDSGTNLVAGSKTLMKIAKHPDVKNHFKQDLEWKFLIKRSPWTGGFYERLIGLTKLSLKKALGNALITLNALRTIVVEIEAILNDRPLTYVSNDIEELSALTPSKLLIGYRLDSFPDITHIEELSDPTYSSKPVVDALSRNLSFGLKSFWTRFKSEYLTALRERKNIISRNSANPKKGEVVIIHDDLTPRAKWKLGVIEELYFSKDDLVRSVRLRTANGQTNRPISKLYPLEIESIEEVSDDQNNELSVRPKRKAAVRAAQCFKDQC